MAQRGINKALILGNVGNDPEIRQTQDGKAIANLSIATSEVWKDQQGQRQEKSEWHRVVAYGKLAEIIGQYVKKGSKVYIEGKIQTRKWQDQSGNDKYTTEIVANEMQMLDSPSQGQGQQQGGYQQPQQQQPVSGMNARQPNPSAQGGYAQPQQPAQAQQGGQDFDPDIPF